MNKKVFKLVIGVIAAVVAGGVIQACTESQGKEKAIPKSTEAVPVKVMQPEKVSGATVMKLSGQISTDDETVLGFKTAGVIKSVLVKEGDRVKKGQVLATLDLTEIDAQVAQARHGYEKAMRDYTRMANLYKDSVVTLEQFQNTETARDIAKEQLDAAMFNRSFSSIHAPANGFVLKKFVNAGQVIGIGDPVVKTNGAAASDWILKVGVSDRQWAAISINHLAVVKLDAFPEKSFNALVARKSETSDPQTGAFTIEIALKNGDTKLATGMFGSAIINIGSGNNAWKIPYEAVLDANGSEGFVFVTADQKIAIKKPITISSFDGNSVSVSKGLEGSEALIVTGSAYLNDQSPIIIVK
jgi:RND family efflux transporter MFP subunit